MSEYYTAPDLTLYCGDALTVLRELPGDSVQTAITSPPFYQLRDYGCAGQIGLEPTLTAYLDRLVAVFAAVRRVLRPDGLLWLEMGDTYARAAGDDATRGMPNTGQARVFAAGGDLSGHGNHRPPAGFRAKELMLVPHRLAIALGDDGWLLRQDVVWYRPNAMPEPVADRPVRSHSYVFQFAREGAYYYDADALRTRQLTAARGHWLTGEEAPGQFPKRYGLAGRQGALRQATRVERPLDPRGANARSVWEIPTEPTDAAHFAVMATRLARICILAGSRSGDTVLDPFAGTGTTLAVARSLGRQSIGIELNPAYCALAVQRIEAQTPALTLGGEAAG